MPDNNFNPTINVTIEMPLALRLKLDELRIARARRDGGLCPKLKAVVVEALESFLTREASR